MNAESYLRKQGWKGSGHSLDTTGRGIKKPLLIAHKQDQLGLGKKKAAWTTDDQWWMRAYDQSLQTIGSGQDSTLSQIRTKGINRGGLYGFFVKGEAIAGTIDDSSASATDASIPPSGASTPPTSDSESEAPTKSVKMADKETKRKRQDEVEPKVAKKAKKTNMKSDKKEKAAPEAPSSSDQAEVNRKIAKFSPKKREWYEKRAAAKNQTINDYILRRVQKKSIKLAKRRTKSVPPAPFFTDLEGDVTLLNQATAAAVGATELSIPQQPLPETESTLPDVSEPAAEETPQKPAQKKVHGNKSGEKKRYKAAMRAKRQLKKEEKKAVKAEKRANKSTSKFGKNKDKSRYNKNKAKKGVVTEGKTA